MKVVILAGGGGTRLWPISRKNKPKQVQPLVGNKTLLQKTYFRLRRGVRAADIYISTNVVQLDQVKKQLPEAPLKNFIIEPQKKETAPAIGLAAFKIAKDFPLEMLTLANSDHFIRNEGEYIRTLKLAEKVIQQNPRQTLLVGIRPTYPETGYGYVKINKIFKQYGNDEVFYGQKFVEKPDLETAQKYIKRWDYLWNSAIFCWRADHLVNLYKNHLPNHYRILSRMSKSFGLALEQKVISREFVKMKPISIDYGIMEKIRKFLVIPANFDWADIGHWRAVKEILAKKPEDNIVRGRHLDIGSHDNLIYSFTGKLVATAGLKDTIIIDTEDALLVCNKSRAQDVKKIVEVLEKRKMKKYL